MTKIEDTIDWIFDVIDRHIWEGVMIVVISVLAFSMINAAIPSTYMSDDPIEFTNGSITLTDINSGHQVFHYSGKYFLDDRGDEYIIVASNNTHHYKKSDNLMCVQESVNFVNKKG